MNKCEECGLPFDVCNALAMYREAVKHYKLGRPERASDFADSAKEFYDNYRQAKSRVEASGNVG